MYFFFLEQLWFFKKFYVSFYDFQTSFSLKSFVFVLGTELPQGEKKQKKKTKVRKTGKSWGFDKICLTSDFLCLNLQCLFSKAFKWQKKIIKNPLYLEKKFQNVPKIYQITYFLMPSSGKS